MRLASAAVIAIAAGVTTGCQLQTTRTIMAVEPMESSCFVRIEGPDAIGNLHLWLPEAIVSNSGVSSAYPEGTTWSRTSRGWSQHIPSNHLFSGGNVVRVAPDTLECAGIQFPVDEPVEWDSTVTADKHRVTFEIELKNVGNHVIRRAGAAICLKFMNSQFWSDDHVWVRSGGQVMNLAQLGRNAGRENGFQAYLLEGQSYDNRFYQEFWGFNQHELDIPIMVSHHRQADVSVVIAAEDAYFMHSNPGNPCTDVMLAFGDLAPGECVSRSGSVSIFQGAAIADLLNNNSSLLERLQG